MDSRISSLYSTWVFDCYITGNLIKFKNYLWILNALIWFISGHKRKISPTSPYLNRMIKVLSVAKYRLRASNKAALHRTGSVIETVLRAISWFQPVFGVMITASSSSISLLHHHFVTSIVTVTTFLHYVHKHNKYLYFLIEKRIILKESFVMTKRS